MSDQLTEKHVGRPKEPLELWEDWYNDILDLYKEGASNEEIKALIYEHRGSFSNDLWDRWIKEEEEFSETIKIGLMLSKAWWLKEGRINLKSIKEPMGVSVTFNYTGWYMQMKNRFSWSDKVDNNTNVTISREEQLSDEELEKELNSCMDD